MKRRDSRRSARLWPRKDEHYDKPNHTVVLVCAVQTSAPALINQHCQRCHESIPRTTGDSLEINICLTSDARLRDERKNTAECHRSARTTAESQLVQHLHEQIYTTEPACKHTCVTLQLCSFIYMQMQTNVRRIKPPFRSGRASSTLAGESSHICCRFHGLGEH